MSELVPATGLDQSLLIFTRFISPAADLPAWLGALDLLFQLTQYRSDE